MEINSAKKLKKLEGMSSTPKYRTRMSDIVFEIVNHTFFLVFALACIFPFYYLFINTISDNELVRIGAITLIPKGIHFRNYLSLTNVNDLGQAFKISILRTIIGTALMVGSTALVGFLVTKQEMWGRSIWYRFMVITMYFNAGLIPWYLNMSMLGLTDNFLGYIIPGIVAPYNIILVKTYIESIPAELEESAYIDGATYMTVFRKIIWPLSKPILATIAIFGAVGNWNSFQDSLILMQNDASLHTLQHRLWTYLNEANNLAAMMQGANGQLSASQQAQLLDSKTIKYTVSMVTVLPIMFVYPFMQRYFEKGIMLGAVKG
ncbi:MAG TPA: carbohydrate ABC transporter permease [Mobilitalea sp.]|nr:carbohydrate ABC transporter permease [Mobilitalea sp.]